MPEGKGLRGEQHGQRPGGWKDKSEGGGQVERGEALGGHACRCDVIQPNVSEAHSCKRK